MRKGGRGQAGGRGGEGVPPHADCCTTRALHDRDPATRKQPYRSASGGLKGGARGGLNPASVLSGSGETEGGSRCRQLPCGSGGRHSLAVGVFPRVPSSSSSGPPSHGGQPLKLVEGGIAPVGCAPLGAPSVGVSPPAAVPIVQVPVQQSLPRHAFAEVPAVWGRLYPPQPLLPPPSSALTRLGRCRPCRKERRREASSAG